MSSKIARFFQSIVETLIHHISYRARIGPVDLIPSIDITDGDEAIDGFVVVREDFHDPESPFAPIDRYMVYGYYFQNRKMAHASSGLITTAIWSHLVQLSGVKPVAVIDHGVARTPLGIVQGLTKSLKAALPPTLIPAFAPH